MFSGNNDFTMPVVPAYGNNANNAGWGGDGAWWIIVFVLFFAFGGWGNGFGGNNGANGLLTRADLCQDMNFGQVENGVRGIQQGLCDGFYAVNTSLLNGFNGVDNAICSLGYQQAQGFHGVDNAICSLGYNVQQGFNNANVVALQNQNALQAQISSCCCDNRVGQMQLGNSIERGFCDTNYNAATNTTAIIQNAHNDTDRVLAKLDAMEMARKDETIADLRTKLASCGDQATAQYIINQLSNVINPPAVPAYPAASPCGLGNWNPNVLANGYNGYSYNNGCGCNSGCCGCNA